MLLLLLLLLHVRTVRCHRRCSHRVGRCLRLGLLGRCRLLRLCLLLCGLVRGRQRARQPLQGGGQLLEGGARLGVGLHACLDQAAPLRLAGRRRGQVQRAVHEAHEDLLRRQLLEGHLQCHHLPHNHAHAPHVTLLAHLGGVGHQLGRHVGQRAAQVVARHVVVELVLGQPKVGHLDQDVVALALHQQVVGLEVKVDDSGRLVVQVRHA
mmetsp:Transcript_21947/g.55867  ORF Transcript_21947/g.55867 Transcript_21947/m.55867 type:complete len:209 (-) Transcript_21947:2030-2656(-)